MTENIDTPDDGSRTGSSIDPHIVSVRTRVAFGVGATSETLCLYSLSLLGMFYYNQVLGLDVLLAGLVPTIAMFADAISDPLVGSMSDRWCSKRWGRRHPFMFAAPIPVATCFWCVFNPPGSLDGGSLFAWFLTWSILLRTFMTVFLVPHLAMGAELAKEYTERTKIVRYNVFLGWMGGAPLFKINTAIFFASVAQYANGLLNPEPTRCFRSVSPWRSLCCCFRRPGSPATAYRLFRSHWTMPPPLPQGSSFEIFLKPSATGTTFISCWPCFRFPRC